MLSCRLFLESPRKKEKKMVDISCSEQARWHSGAAATANGFGKPEPVLNAPKYGQFVSKKAMLASKKTIVPCVYPQSEPCN